MSEPRSFDVSVDPTAVSEAGDESGSESSWASLTQSLAQGIGRMNADQYLILDVVDTGDGNGEPSGYYVQFASGGDDGVRAEAVSNRYLADRWKLPEKTAELLFQLGWTAPDPEGQKGGNVNFHRSWPSPAPTAEIAQLAVSTLRRAYGVGSMDQLEYRYFEKGGAELELADLGLRREAARKDDSHVALAALRPLVEQALRQALGVGEIKYDPSGDIPVRFGNAMVFVRIVGGPPRVRIFSPMLWELRTTDGLFEALNDINARIDAGRAFWTGREVVAAVDLPAPGLTGEYLALACFQIGSLADHVDDQLVSRFGGRTMFQEAATSGEEATHKPASGPGYL
jgi:hypothetical protein